MSAQTIDECVDSFVFESAIDYVQLREVVGEAKRFVSAGQFADVRAGTDDLVRRLLAAGLVAVDGAIVPWPDQRPDAVVARINREWDALGRDPSIWDIMLFDHPDPPASDTCRRPRT